MSTESPANLHEFLCGAVKKAVPIGGAGAIYLHNPLHDELIMAASCGFPFQHPNGRESFKKACENALRNVLANRKPSEYDLEEFERNINRLAYLRDVLRPRIAGTTLARHDWVRYALRGTYDNSGQANKVDCNEDLVGIAYYKPGKGITGQLFDKEEGPKMERTRLSEAEGLSTFAGKFESELRRQLDLRDGEEDALFKHLRHELLQKRTVVYDERNDMGAGRQVRAGQYEPLQFPDSCFIGPFLGTVLRFNGEHLGILKIEKHKYDPSVRDDDSLAKWKNAVGNAGFKGLHTASFLLFSYALSGYLYVLKHHAGIDLSEGWTTSVEKQYRENRVA